MRHATTTTAPTLAAALAIAAGGSIITPAMAAAPATATASRTLAAAGATASTVRRVDVDGDGRRDTVTAALSRTGRLTVTVKTARGKTASLDVNYDGYPDEKPSLKYMFLGTATLDGVRGADILIDPSSFTGDAWWWKAYTWRNGRLVQLKAPGSDRRGYWGQAYFPEGADGYTFSTVKGVRTVLRHELRSDMARPARYSGTFTTYRWTAKGWHKVSARRVSGISSTTAQHTYYGFHGIRIS